MSASGVPVGSGIDLAQAVARLQAAELLRSALAAYSHAVDTRDLEALSALFASDAEFHAVNFPAGGGSTMVRSGRAAILKVCLALDPVELRHHISNVSVDVAPDARTAVSSAYFLHTHPARMSGGVYEGRWACSAREGWQIVRWQVTLGWEQAWREPGYTFSEPLSAHTLFRGRPVAWDRTLADAPRATSDP